MRRIRIFWAQRPAGLAEPLHIQTGPLGVPQDILYILAQPAAALLHAQALNLRGGGSRPRLLIHFIDFELHSVIYPFLIVVSPPGSGTPDPRWPNGEDHPPGVRCSWTASYRPRLAYTYHTS